MEIDSIKTRWVLDSLGNPTIEVDVILASGAYGRASVPTGSNTTNEALELKDNSKMFAGQGVSRALNTIEHTIAPVLLKAKADNQEAIDAKILSLDKSKNKGQIGANTSLAISLAVAKAASNYYKVPFYSYIGGLAANKKFELPRPIFSMLGGGLHAQKTSDIESVLVIPSKAKDIHTAVRQGVEVYSALKNVLDSRSFALVKAVDGSFAPVGVKRNKQVVDLVVEATRMAGYNVLDEIYLGVDMAAEHLYQKAQYVLKCDNLSLGPKAYLDWFKKFIKNQPIRYIEDPFANNDVQNWKELNSTHGLECLIAGDDLIATNDKNLRFAIKENALNAILIKPIQIGTLSETIQTFKVAKKAAKTTIVAARSGETDDSYLAHLAVGLDCEYIKCGAPANGERVAKYNELLRISESLQSDQIKKGV